MKVFHGGNLSEASTRFDVPLDAWVDLSTGINPTAYPVPEFSPACWARLPDPARVEDLKVAAASCYGVASPKNVVAVSGTQTLLQVLPYVFGTKQKVRIVAPTYKEHEHCWALAGHDVQDVVDLESALNSGDIVILVNPNNPTGKLYETAEVLAAAQKQAAKGGWLIVDQAFMDCTPDFDISPHVGMTGLMVLRSFGKFFGLAGIRLGFVLAPDALAARLEEGVGPWCVNGPAIEIGIKALNDAQWISRMCHQLETEAQRMDDLLERAGLVAQGAASLFRFVRHPLAKEIYNQLGRQGILVRPFADIPDALRFGLPGADDWPRLENALTGLKM